MSLENGKQDVRRGNRTMIGICCMRFMLMMFLLLRVCLVRDLQRLKQEDEREAISQPFCTGRQSIRWQADEVDDGHAFRLGKTSAS